MADYPTEVGNLSPFLYWKIDEASGALADSSGNSNASVAQSITTYQDTDIISEAGAAEFNGSSDYAKDTAASAYVVDGVMSAVFAFRYNDTLPASGTLFHIGDFGNGSNRGFRFYFAAGVTTLQGWASSNFRTVNIAWQPTIGVDSLVAIVLTTTNVKIYVDGTEVASTNHSWTFNNNTTTPPVTLGSAQSSGESDFMQADYGHFALFNQALTPAEITTLSDAAFVSGPTIDTQPVSDTVDENTTASFTVAATASAGSLSYQWQENTGAGFADITGETGTTLSFTAVEGDDGNTYRCVVTDSNGSTNSSAATLTVTALTPTISAQPSSDTVFDGNPVSFTVVATASVGALTYQWYDASDDSTLAGEDQSTLSFTAALADNGNTYYVIITDSNGSVQSDTVTLTVEANPVTILVDPVTQAISQTQQADLEVYASGVGPLAYQWYDAADDSAIAGATSNKLTVREAISVYCTVTDEAGTSATSETAVITVIDIGLVDDTDQPAAVTLPGPGTTSFRKYEWDALVAAVEKQSVEVDDYRFSGRTFRRRDNLLNPGS